MAPGAQNLHSNIPHTVLMCLSVLLSAASDGLCNEPASSDAKDEMTCQNEPAPATKVHTFPVMLLLKAAIADSADAADCED